MAYRKVAVASHELTPELVAAFAEMTPLPGEREPRQSRTAYLLAQLLRGNFNGPDWAEGRCLATGQTHRLDGQHSSKLLASLPEGVPFPEGLLATVTQYEFDSMDDAANVFNLFNHPKSVRNNQDMVGVYAAKVAELAGYSRDFLVNVGNGFYDYERKRYLNKAKDALLLGARDRGMYFGYPNRPEFLAYTHWLAEFRDTKNKRFLDKSVIVAEMVTHRQSAPEAASVFWPLVFTEGHPDPDHETRLLAEWFREQLAVAAHPKLDMGVFRKKTLRAWKAFRAAAGQVAA